MVSCYTAADRPFVFSVLLAFSVVTMWQQRCVQLHHQPYIQSSSPWSSLQSAWFTELLLARVLFLLLLLLPLSGHSVTGNRLLWILDVLATQSSDPVAVAGEKVSASHNGILLYQWCMGAAYCKVIHIQSPTVWCLTAAESSHHSTYVIVSFPSDRSRRLTELSSAIRCTLQVFASKWCVRYRQLTTAAFTLQLFSRWSHIGTAAIRRLVANYSLFIPLMDMHQQQFTAILDLTHNCSRPSSYKSLASFLCYIDEIFANGWKFEIVAAAITVGQLHIFKSTVSRELFSNWCHV